MAEWSIAAVLKTVELRGSGGSNPSFSAESSKSCFLRFMEAGCFLIIHNQPKRRDARVVEEARLESV